MSKKDYELITKAIRNIVTWHEEGTNLIVTSKHNVIVTLCQYLQEENPRFNKEKFIASAYGVK